MSDDYLDIHQKDGRPLSASSKPTNGRIFHRQSEIWQHVESGGIYTVVCCGLNVVDLIPVTIYRSLWDGSIWVCPTAEFEDGRFRNIAVEDITDCRPSFDRESTTEANDLSFRPSDDVIAAARELRDALMDDCPFGSSEMGEDWFLRTWPQLAAISEAECEDEERDR